MIAILLAACAILILVFIYQRIQHRNNTSVNAKHYVGETATATDRLTYGIWGTITLPDGNRVQAQPDAVVEQGKPVTITKAISKTHVLVTPIKTAPKNKV